MNIDLDYKTFSEAYYDIAVQIADITIAEHIKSHGPLNPYIDVTLVKDLGVSYGLEKVYNTFDVDHESKAHIKTYMWKVVHNCVLTELGKESTAVGAKKRRMGSVDVLQDAGTFGGRGKFGGFRDYIESGRKYEKKEELIAQMLQCMKKLSGEDQVILRCWMIYPKREYTDRALEELGRENNSRTRNVISVRRDRAIVMLRKMMGGARSDYRDIYVPTHQNAPSQPAEPNTLSSLDYNFVRRRQRAAKKSITSGIDYRGLAKSLSTSLPD